MSNSSAEIGVIGLGVMGAALSLNIADKGFKLAVYNRDDDSEKGTVSNFLSTNALNSNIYGFTNLHAFISKLERPRKIVLLISASAVDLVLNDLLPLLDPNDIIIDAGNSHYKETEIRQKRCLENEVEFIGCGISGGEKGARFGPSIMPGGSKSAFSMVETYLKTIASKDIHGNPCMNYVGSGGSGHFVKMVHNGIEYVEMQLIAEIYQLLREQHSNTNIAEIYNDWNTGPLKSFLLEISSRILAFKEGEEILVENILDKAGNKGTGSWSTIAALQLGTENSMMSAAVFARYISSFKRLRTFLNSQTSTEKNDLPIELKSLKSAYQCARKLNHLQGFELIRAASAEFNWNIDLAEIARIWTNGCIIRSLLMEQLSETFKDCDSLLTNSDFVQSITENENSISKIIRDAAGNRVAIPAFSSAWNYWIGLTTEFGPANLIQAQRDFFGSHRYQRVDDPSGKTYHTNWEK